MFLSTHLDRRGSGNTRKENTMLNIVEKYSAETSSENDQGVVAIEYVVVSAAIVAALAALWTAFGTALAAKLDEIVTSI